MPLMRNTFLSLIMEYVALQTALQDEFLKNHPTVKDWAYLTDLPRSGSLKASGVWWRYARHGLGVRFEGDNCIVVDIHNHLLEKGVVDAHRIREYITSKYKQDDDPKIYEECDKSLRAAEQAGLIEEIGSGQKIWRLV